MTPAKSSRSGASDPGHPPAALAACADDRALSGLGRHPPPIGGIPSGRQRLHIAERAIGVPPYVEIGLFGAGESPVLASAARVDYSLSPA